MVKNGATLTLNINVYTFINGYIEILIHTWSERTTCDTYVITNIRSTYIV